MHARGGAGRQRRRLRARRWICSRTASRWRPWSTCATPASRPLAERVVAQPGIRDAARGTACVEAIRPSGGVRGGRRVRRSTPTGAPTGASRDDRLRRRADERRLGAGAAACCYQAGAKMRYDDARRSSSCPTTLPRRACSPPAGSTASTTLDDAAARRRARRARRRAHLGLARRAARRGRRRARRRQSHPYPIFAHPTGKNFVDFDEDLQLADFVNAAQEGFDNIELLKRYTHRRHGAEPGQALEHERRAHPGALRGEPVGDGRHHHRAAVLPSGADGAPGRPRLPRRVRRTPMHEPARGARRASGCRRATGCGPSTTRAPARARCECGARRSARGARRRRADRRRHARQDRGRTARMPRSCSSASTPAASPNLAVGTTRYARDARRGRRGDRRRRRRAPGRRALLRHHDHHRRGARSTARCSGCNRCGGSTCGCVNVTGHCAAMNLAGPRAREVLAALHRRATVATRRFPTSRVREGEVAGVAGARAARRLRRRARLRDPRAGGARARRCGMR